MKPRRETLIGSSKGINQGDGCAVLSKKEGGHKKGSFSLSAAVQWSRDPMRFFPLQNELFPCRFRQELSLINSPAQSVLAQEHVFRYGKLGHLLRIIL